VADAEDDVRIEGPVVFQIGLGEISSFVRMGMEESEHTEGELAGLALSGKLVFGIDFKAVGLRARISIAAGDGEGGLAAAGGFRTDENAATFVG